MSHRLVTVLSESQACYSVITSTILSYVLYCAVCTLVVCCVNTCTVLYVLVLYCVNTGSLYVHYMTVCTVVAA